MRSIAVARWFAARPHFVHIRTRHRSPETNGIIERFFESLKYERLYRHDIADGLALADHVGDYLDVYNRIRPHETIAWGTGWSTSGSPAEPTAGPSPDRATVLGPVKEGRLYGPKATCAAGSTLKHRLFGRT